MRRIRVLVADGAALMRGIMSEALSADPAIEVVGTASNARFALGKLARLEPDLVTIDLELSDAERLELLREIRRERPRTRVLLIGTFGTRGAPFGVDVAPGGTTASVTRPPAFGGRAETMRWIQMEISPRARTLCAGAIDGELPPPPRPAEVPTPAVRAIVPAANARLDAAAHTAETRRRRVEVLVIGTSTGGPNALSSLLPELGPDLPVPVLIVQHMPPTFTRFLADRLGNRSNLRVAEAVHGAALRPGDMWIAPGDHHLTIERRGTEVCLALNQDPPENSCRPAANVLFRSAARIYGAGTLAVVLTGMGRDGMLGCDAIRGQGGQVIVQDSATSVVWGMPGAVAGAGLADQVLPLDSIGEAITRAIGMGRRPRRGADHEDVA